MFVIILNWKMADNFIKPFNDSNGFRGLRVQPNKLIIDKKRSDSKGAASSIFS